MLKRKNITWSLGIDIRRDVINVIIFPTNATLSIPCAQYEDIHKGLQGQKEIFVKFAFEAFAPFKGV